ncbi:fungal-specific transcription factor domain-containing protein [Hypoxylon rubiginosum]|uniref:Fungal-specific transcription factor domain-containing protein n=1 Tax=Hypoxylon rubiginosum TaxID=110542 RepID=A0ACC0DIR7_9PEZI|nr:fungal-specific transcription factor domain-containing protein [Hypoxylon rubiginosum]
MSPEQDINQVPIQDLTPEQASHIIHSHRKVRYGTACWPCRQRKVKCDNKQPCENCVKREHPQLCSYKPNRSSASKQASVPAESHHHGKKRPHSPDDSINNDHGSDHQPDGWPQALDEPESVEISRYVGQNSIPALLRDQPSPIETKDGVDIRRDMRPILGLDNSAPFPLMSSKHLDRLTQDIFSELPSDREVMILFRAYKEITHPFWGFVIDIDDLESRIMIYLEERAKNAREQGKSNRRVSASWLAILFSVMAVGSQYRDSPYHIRTRDAQRYVQISFHFLRLGNFLLRPNLDSIQALLITGFCLLNDMKAEASWALIGMTCRLAQSLGLHRTVAADENSSPEIAAKAFARRKLWWTCLWHDTLTSLSFDRPNMTNIQCCPIPLSPNPSGEGLSYIEAMYTLCQVISARLNPDDTDDYSYEKITENCDAIEAIRNQVYPQLRSKEACKSVVDKLQHYAIRLHTAFVVSVCCRPALRRDCANLGDGEKKALADRCKINLTETVRMFLSMHQLSFIPTRSWAFTYHGLSSAVLLGILCETKQDPEVRQLQGDLISALSAAAAKEHPSPTPEHIPKIDRDIELSGPLSRALTALKNIYDYGSLHGASGVKSESASGTRTPTGGIIPQGFQNNNQFRLQPGFDRHQDAALAMAELQNGNSLSDFATTMPYQPSIQQPLGLPDLTQLDPTTLAPMDLYDSIFWESPDPFYTGADMNFDFLPQAPPGQSQQQYYF